MDDTGPQFVDEAAVRCALGWASMGPRLIGVDDSWNELDDDPDDMAIGINWLQWGHAFFSVDDSSSGPMSPAVNAFRRS